ncbi:MAG: hypothetical protein ACI358_05870 [Candidatus Limimorpha sp.]
MESKALTKEEILCLISEFKTEINKNYAKIEFFNEKIIQLKQQLENSCDSSYYLRKEEKRRKPYPLSPWDKIVIDVIKENGKPTLSREIYEKSMQKAEELGIAMDEIKMKAKINQCLVKLSGRRDDITKIKYGDKGFAYCLREWEWEK